MGTLNAVLTVGIIVFGVFVLWKMILVGSKLKKIFKDFESIRGNVSLGYEQTVEAEGDIVQREQLETRYNRSALEKSRDSYYKAYASYVVYSQIISVFPLLGILGTVLGLIMQGDAQNIDGLVGGLSVALYTTLAGLIVSIILKIFDAHGVGKYVNLLDSEFEKADSAISHQLLKEEIASTISRNMSQR